MKHEQEQISLKVIGEYFRCIYYKKNQRESSENLTLERRKNLIKVHK